MDEQNWFGTSESGHLEALKVASDDNITLTISKVEVSCAGIFRQKDYNIPSNEKWTIPPKDCLMVLTTTEGDILVYQKSAINSIGQLLGKPCVIHVPSDANGFSALTNADPKRPDQSGIAEWVMETPLHLTISRASGRYGIYSAAIVGGGL